MVINHPNRKIVEAVGLTKVFKDFWMRTKARAVDSVDFEIHSGEIFGLLGPNGSGKSTIIKMILGLLHKTSGRLTVFGRPPADVAVKKHIGFLPEESYLYRYLNSRETLDYYGKLFGLDHRTRRRRTEELLDMVGLTQVAHRPIGEFSKGMTRRIGLAQAIINDPDFLILDEPTSGLDPIGTRQVKDLILELGKRGKTILLSSHLLADVEDVCDRMVMLYGGRIRAQGTVDELLCDSERTVIETARLDEKTISRLEEVIQECEGAGIDKVHVPRQRLEHLFLEIVEQARLEQVDTSGAIHSGATAAFLRAAEEETGKALIESLISERRPEEERRAVEVTRRAAETSDESAREDVLAGLIGSEESDPDAASKSRPAADPAPPPQAPADVDASVIESLLADDESAQTGDASPTSGQ
ncbi:MAG: ABC transporter ATP-binding protein [Phycisphaerales bacterium]|nr:MAG: ABC transporter ATP-binding protein [Phycisphaerales bacterium]